jgi:hypothetical protein
VRCEFGLLAPQQVGGIETADALRYLTHQNNRRRVKDERVVLFLFQVL